MDNIQCVVVSKYDHIFETFAESYLETIKYPLIVVCGNELSGGIRAKYNQFRYVDEPPPPFSIYAAFNVGIRAVGTDCDVVVMCDDIYIHTANIVDKLSAVAYDDDFVGITVPLINNATYGLVQVPIPLQHKTLFVERMPYIKTKRRISYELVYLKRQLIDKIGLFDEGYRWHRGSDDYTYSSMLAGYQSAVAYATFVQHGGPMFGSDYGNTTGQLKNEDVFQDHERWVEKWSPVTFDQVFPNWNSQK